MSKHISPLVAAASAALLPGLGGPGPVIAAPKPEVFVPKAPAIIRARTLDGMITFDAATRDSTGAFLVNELERLDPTIHEPLAAVTWQRDIDLREDVTIADETASFTNSTFAAAGGATGGGKSWVGKDSNTMARVALDIGKTAHPLNLWGMTLSWTIPELQAAIKLGRPIDADKLKGMTLKHQMDIDEQVYVGDSGLSLAGLLNSAAVTPTNAPNGAASSPLWKNKTPTEILADINAIINAVWLATGFARFPNRILLPPYLYSYLSITLISSAGNQSILKYVMENNVCTLAGQELKILPVKWLIGGGAGGTRFDATTASRMVAYIKEHEMVRFPMTALQNTPIENRSIWQETTYFGRLGQVEFVYPETVAYVDGM